MVARDMPSASAAFDWFRRSRPPVLATALDSRGSADAWRPISAPAADPEGCGGYAATRRRTCRTCSALAWRGMRPGLMTCPPVRQRDVPGRSPASGPTCTGRSTSMARSSTSCCPGGVTWRPPGASLPGRCARARSRPRSPPTVPLSTRGSSTRLVPSALHTVKQYANNPIETDHGRPKARLRPMRGLKRHRSARILAAGHAFVQNLRRGHYDIATDVPDRHRLRIAFDDLAITI